MLLAMILSSCNRGVSVCEWVSSTSDSPWQMMLLEEKVVDVPSSNDVTIHVDTENTRQSIKGFGTCFNEKGWQALSYLPQTDRTFILKDLFAPAEGAKLTICRIPMGANDFSIDWYTYDEVDADFDLRHFSINHDEHSLIPYVKAALDQNPVLELWAVPYFPPLWMRRDKHYSTSEAAEGAGGFIMDNLYLQAYASYFGKFIDEYKLRGINVGMVMPQNRFNATQGYPSCTWSATDMIRFLHFLGSEMEKRHVELFLGTWVEQTDMALIDSILNDSISRRYVCGFGFQQLSREVLSLIKVKYPELRLYHTEQEYRNEHNNWEDTRQAWMEMKYYLNHGVQVYNYGSIALIEGAVDYYGRHRSSLVVVDTLTFSYRFTPEYYLLKHVSHYVKPGARLLQLGEDCYQDALAFVNPDKSVAIIAANRDDRPIELMLDVCGKERLFCMQPQSFHTWLYK